MPQVFIIDYGVGNLLSLKFALEKTGLDVNISPPTKQLEKADAIALPGVGNFSAAAKTLQPVKEAITEKVREGTPIIGICLGLQLFFEDSEEGPGEGLGLFKGTNVQLQGSVKVPHMGWNSLELKKQTSFFEGVEDKSYVYFVHSLYPVPIDEEIICAQTEYETIFTSAVVNKNVFGTQFHPEKSGDIGLKILNNFARIIKR